MYYDVKSSILLNDLFLEAGSAKEIRYLLITQIRSNSATALSIIASHLCHLRLFLTFITKAFKCNNCMTNDHYSDEA